jgi:hypothetical protein
MLADNSKWKYFGNNCSLHVFSVAILWPPGWRPAPGGPAGTVASYSSSEPASKTTLEL